MMAFMLVCLTASAFGYSGATSPPPDVGFTLSAPSLQYDLASVAVPSMDYVTVSVVHVSDFLTECAAFEVKPTIGLQAPKLSLKKRNAVNVYIYNTRYRCSLDYSWRLRVFGNIKFNRHSKLN